MQNTDPQFEAMLELAEAQSLTGWDFSWLNERTSEEPLPWDYRQRVRERMSGWTELTGHRHRVEAMLDVGTGGGELLATLAPFPPITWATEGYPPNVPVARERLEPLGIRVLDVSGAEDDPIRELADESLDLVIDRHNGISGPELVRLLRPGGRYLTQQVGGQNCLDINHALQEHVSYLYADVTLDNAVRDLEEAGLMVMEAREAFPAWRFHDVAGVIFYLQAIPWQVTGFTVAGYRDKLYEIHKHIQREGSWVVREHRFLVEAEKPKPGSLGLRWQMPG